MKIINGTIASPKGFSAYGIHCGLKYKKKDIGYIFSEVPAQAAAVYTTNEVKAAPIQVTKEAIDDGHTLQAILVNSAVANACTGNKGLQDAYTSQKILAQHLQIQSKNIGVASTGIIGKMLPMTTLTKGIVDVVKDNHHPKNFHEAILTTDTFTKEITVQSMIDGHIVTMSGVAKGSGMIHPNMATMLAFITTDACINSELLDTTLRIYTNQSFNQITVDGDTSTNDMVIVMANGLACNSEILYNSPEYSQFCSMFQLVTESLAKMIAKDGEGATKLIETKVIGGPSKEIANKMAKSIVGSSLVKSAMFGEDPNWGRIICAMGYAGIPLDSTKIDIFIGKEKVLENGQPLIFNKEKTTEILAKETIHITADLKQGDAVGMAWGCDLTYKYVEINANYST